MISEELKIVTDYWRSEYWSLSKHSSNLHACENMKLFAFFEGFAAAEGGAVDGGGTGTFAGASAAAACASLLQQPSIISCAGFAGRD